MKFKPVILVILLFVSLGSISAQNAKTFVTSYYEGENYTNKSADCKAATENFPYVGLGYLDMGGNGSFAEWNNIYSEKGGNHTLLIKYANASGNNRPCELKVNGVTVKNILFPARFADWNYYWIARVTINLNAGNNTIRITANTSTGGPNIDNIAVSVDEGLCSPPGTQYNVRDYGAKGDGSTNDTQAIQAAINACTDGGSVILSGGTFMSGQIRLKSNTTLWIDSTAVLKGIQNNSLYPAITQHADNANVWLSGVPGGGGWELKEAFVYAEGINNVTIAGGGAIDGNGDCPIWDNTKDETLRPMALYLAYSRNVRVANIEIMNSAMWDFVILECDTVIVDGININSSTYGVNKDGIDICDSHNVTITNSTILCQDDAICPKSGSATGVNNMTIKNVTVNGTTGNKIKFGTLTYGAFTNCLLQDISINGSGRGGLGAISLQGLDGADFSNITFDRINLATSANAFFLLNSGGKRGHRPKGAPAKTGSIDRITFSNLEFRNITDNVGSYIGGIDLDGTVHKVKNVTFDNVKVNSFKGGVSSIPGTPGEYGGNYPEYNVFGKLPAWGYYVRYAENINFTNCSHTVSPSDARQAIVMGKDVSTTGISVSPISDIGLYPNPVVDMLFVKGVSENAGLMVYNMSGTKLLQTKGQSINVENIPDGMFLVTIEDNNRSVTLKSVKEAD